MLVLRDADLEKASNAATYYSMQNGGQTCISVERVYVEEPVYDEFVRLVTEKVSALRQGEPAGPGNVDVGAVTFATADRDRGLARGRTPARRAPRSPSGGKSPRGRGPLLRAHAAAGRGPLDDVHDRGDLRPDAAGHEGRPTPRRRCDWPTTPRTALRHRCGPRTPTRGESIARRLEAGASNVNEHQVSYLALELPMGGWKSSGLGSRHGADGIRKYARKQSSVVTRFGPKRETVHVPVQQARLEADRRAAQAAARPRQALTPGVSAGPGRILASPPAPG